MSLLFMLERVLAKDTLAANKYIEAIVKSENFEYSTLEKLQVLAPALALFPDSVKINKAKHD